METTEEPNLLWLVLATLSGLFLYGVGRVLFAEPDPEAQQRRRKEQEDRKQGRVPAPVIAEKLAVKESVILGEVEPDKKRVVPAAVLAYGPLPAWCRELVEVVTYPTRWQGIRQAWKEGFKK